MVRHSALAATLLIFLVSSLAGPIEGDTYVRFASKREFNGIYTAYVVTSLRGQQLEANLASRLTALCSEDVPLEKYKIFVYAEPESADFAKDNVGTLPDLTDQRWQRMERELLATYSPFNSTLTFRGLEPESGAAAPKSFGLGKDWCRK